MLAEGVEEWDYIQRRETRRPKGTDACDVRATGKN